MPASGKSKGSPPSGSSSKANKRTRKTPSPAKSAEDTQQEQQEQQQAPKTKRRRTTAKKTSPSSRTTRKAKTADKKKASSKANSNNKPSGSTGAAVVGTPSPTAILLVDNGGDTLKYGWVDDNENSTATSTTTTAPRRLPNVTARLKHQWTVLVGDELYNSVQNPNQMHFVTRSTERGIVTNLGNQVQVWKRMLDLLGIVIPDLDHSEAAQTFGWKVTRPGKKAKQQQQQQQQQSTTTATNQKMIPASSVAVLLLVPPHCPRNIIEQMMYCWMEDFGVSHVGFATTQICAAQPHPRYQSGCVVDLGWSATHVVPTFRGTAIMVDNNKSNDGENQTNTIGEPQRQAQSAQPTTAAAAATGTGCPIRRIPLGGRQLVNIWKYYCSYRQWNLMDQEWILRDVFEKLGYISLNFTNEMELARQTPQGRRPFDRNFVLPDFQTTTRGRVELTEALKKQKAAEEAEERKRKKKQQQQQEEQDDDEEEDDDDEEEDEDFEDTKMEEDVELEADDDVGDNENLEMDDAERKDDEAQDDNDVDKEDGAGNEKESNNKTKEGKKRSKKKRKSNKDNNDDDETDDNDSDDEDDDDDDNKDMMRQRLLRQKQEEERRRKELEAEQQVLTVSVERFTVPEVLFLPSDAGLPAEIAGLAHTIVQSIKACPKYLQPALFRSIQLTGGVAQLPNLMERLERDLRALAPAEFDVKVSMADQPIDQAWLGARDWARKTPYTQWSISRDEWEAQDKRRAWMKLLVAKGGLLV